MYSYSGFARHASSVEVGADAIRPSRSFGRPVGLTSTRLGAEWRFTTSKTGTPHIVPLATQAKEILEDLQPLTRAKRVCLSGSEKRKATMSEKHNHGCATVFGI